MSRYPGVSDRIKAMIFDLVIVGIFLFVASGIISKQEQEVSEVVRMLTFIGIVFLYEPVFIAFLGGTIGHKANNLKVKRLNDQEKNINIIFSLVRSAIKYCLGIISLLTMGSNDENRALHDSLVGSVVLYKNPPEVSSTVEEPVVHEDDEVLDANGQEGK